MSASSQIIQKLWNYCNVLRDDLSACHAQANGDYPSVKLRAGVEELTYLLFRKMANTAGRLADLTPVRWVFFSLSVRYHAGK